MAGLTEHRGAERRDDTADSFWTWREQMYRFVEWLGPDELEAIAAFAYMEMLEAGFTSVAEFHYLHHQPDGRPYDNVGEMSERIVAAATFGEAGHGALEGMAVQIGQAGHRDARNAFGGAAARSLDTDDEAVIYPDHDVALPAVRHQRRFEVQFTGHGQPCTVSGSTC